MSEEEADDVSVIVKWTVPNLSSVSYGRTFWVPTPNSAKSKWNIGITCLPCPYSCYSKKLRVYFKRFDSIESDVIPAFGLEFINKSMLKYTLDVIEYDSVEHSWKYSLKDGEVPLDGNFLKSQTTIHCIFEFRREVSEPINHLHSAIVDDFGNLLKNAKFSDVTIRVKDTEFKAHKNILVARSPVFSAMFEHDTIESISNCITISDTEPEIFQEFLHFLYTEQANVDEFASQLYMLGDKYNIESLRSACAEALYHKISIGNCIHALILADRHSLHQNKKRAMDFIVANVNRLTEMNGWDHMKVHQPHLVDEAFLALADRVAGSKQ